MRLARPRPLRFAALAIAAVLVATAVVALAQDGARADDINAPFTTPDLEVGSWIERFESEQRPIFKHRHEIVTALALVEGMDVADVGAGSGFLTLMMAHEVGPSGRVWAVDIAEPFLETIRRRAGDEGLENITTVLGEATSARLEPGSVDLVLVCDTYHHFDHPQEMLRSIHQALRPGGRLALIEFERVVGVSSQFAVDHVRAGRGTFSDEIRDAGFDLLTEVDALEGAGQYFLIFRKR